MKTIYHYSPDTGDIIAVYAVSDDIVERNKGDHCFVHEGAPPPFVFEWYYVDTTADPPAITPRRASPVTVDGAFLRNLPMPCTVIVNEIAYPVNVGELELVLPKGRAHTVRVQAPTFKEFSHEIST